MMMPNVNSTGIFDAISFGCRIMCSGTTPMRGDQVVAKGNFDVDLTCFDSLDYVQARKKSLYAST